MKISFVGRFKLKERHLYLSEIKMNDVFLSFLPNKLEVIKDTKAEYSSWGTAYSIKMELKTVVTLDEIVEQLKSLGILLEKISDVKREFSDKELEEIRQKVCFKKLFEK